MKTYSLKSWPAPFAAVMSGDKTAEFRKDDRGFRRGDTLRLREWSRGGGYTGRETRRVISHIQGGFGIPDGFVVLSLQPLPAEGE